MGGDGRNGTGAQHDKQHGGGDGGGSGNDGDKKKVLSEADRLLAYVEPIFRRRGNEEFRDADGSAYATVPAIAHHETFPVQSRDMRLWLNYQFYMNENRNPRGEAKQLVIEGLESRSRFDPRSQERPVAVRVSKTSPGELWLDLGTHNHEAEQIVAAVRARGRPAELLLFADEGHFMLRGTTQLVGYPAIGDWFERHMG